MLFSRGSLYQWGKMAVAEENDHFRDLPAVGQLKHELSTYPEIGEGDN